MKEALPSGFIAKMLTGSAIVPLVEVRCVKIMANMFWIDYPLVGT